MNANKDIILLNRIRTPDGKIMTSWSVHDYKEYTDANGLMYMVDGGREYLRRTTHDGVEGAEYEELSVWLTDDHEINREAFHWGTRGVHGDQPLVYRPVCDMTTDHIEAVLETQKQVDDTFVESIFCAELRYRLDNKA